MLYMIVERFKGADPDAVGARFRQRDRMLPEGVTYQASWVAASGERCFQLIECRDEESVGAWTRRWADLTDFEIVPVLESTDFWSRRES